MKLGRKKNQELGIPEKPTISISIDGGSFMPRTFPSQLKPENFILTDEMKEVISFIKNGSNLFLTGKAGTGKSTLLDYLRDNVFSNQTIYLGYTGVSALNIDGRTIHSFFRFGPDTTRETVEEEIFKPGNLGLIKKLKTIVIDEISMVRVDLLDCVEIVLRRFGPKKGEPWGGVQIVLIGDARQLPPIVKYGELKFIREQFGSEFFFDANGLEDSDFEIIELTQNFRQSSQTFYEMLDAIRDGRQTDEDLAYLNSRVSPIITEEDKFECIRLTTTNAVADEVNLEELEKIDREVFISKAKVSGLMKISDYPTEATLHIKVGSRIMMVYNDSGGRWVNGTLGIITKIKKSTGNFPEVFILFDGYTDELQVLPHEWDVLEPYYDGQELRHKQIASFEQLPFRLAWAITMHKSQGKTFDKVIIDLTREPFTSGQLYVALSRCRTLEGITFTHPVLHSHVIVNDQVTDFLERTGIGKMMNK